jgi:prolyl 4-hydroxylase
MRLQDTYKLNTSQLANGKISSKFKSRPLSALECYELGRVAYTNGDFYHTLMWMQEALDHLDKERNNTSMNKIDILDHLAYATSQQGNTEHALAITEEMLTIAPNHVRANNNKIYYESILKNRTLTKQEQLNVEKYQVNNERPDDYLEEREIYEKLCRQNGTEVE